MKVLGLVSALALFVSLASSVAAWPNRWGDIAICSPIAWSETRQEIASGDLKLALREEGRLTAQRDEQRGGGWDKFIVYKAAGTSVEVLVEPLDAANRTSGTFTYFADSYRMMPYAVGEIWIPREGCWRVTATDGESTVSMDYLVQFVTGW